MTKSTLKMLSCGNVKLYSIYVGNIKQTTQQLLPSNTMSTTGNNRYVNNI